jgi:hypothetical protein
MKRCDRIVDDCMRPVRLFLSMLVLLGLAGVPTAAMVAGAPAPAEGAELSEGAKLAEGAADPQLGLWLLDGTEGADEFGLVRGCSS